MALSYTNLSSGGATTGFAIDTGDGTKTDVTLTKDYPAGGYQVSSANGNQGLFIFFGASDGSPAGGTSSKSIVATKAFNKLTIIGVTANDLITFTYKETATLNAVGTSSSYSGAVVTSFSPNQISAVNDTLILNGAALGPNVTVKFTGANGNPLNAKSITRVSDTQLIVTRPDTMPGDQDPYRITVQNPGIEPAVSTSTATQPLYAGSAPTWSTAATLPAFTKNTSYTQQLIASDPDNTSVTYSFVSGSLPAGLTYAANSSTISGTPTGSTSATFTIRATEVSGRYTDRSFLLPNAYPVFTTGATLTPYTKNVSYSATIVASDDSGVAPSLSVIGTMPNGLSFNALTGSVSGTPTTTIAQTFTIRATDANGSTTDNTFTIPNTGPTWSTAETLPVYTRNVAYSTTLLANDDGVVTYSLISGTFPTGISLNSSTGVVSGTPTVLTNHSPVVRAQDDAGNYVDRTFTLNLNSPQVPVLNTTSLPGGTFGAAYSTTLSATDDGSYTYSVSSGSLPTGLSLNSSTGVISGTLNGSSTFTITVTDANGQTASRSLTITAIVSVIYTATSSVTLPSGNYKALLVGGGGGGRSGHDGGGGSGRVVYADLGSRAAGTWTVNVGGGGAGAGNGAGNGGNGGTSSIVLSGSTISSATGGDGFNSVGSNGGCNGGSGGGAGGNAGSGASGGSNGGNGGSATGPGGNGQGSPFPLASVSYPTTNYAFSAGGGGGPAGGSHGGGGGGGGVNASNVTVPGQTTSGLGGTSGAGFGGGGAGGGYNGSYNYGGNGLSGVVYIWSY